MSNLDAALKYAQVKGWSIFPCGKDKKPLIDAWPENASTDEKRIRIWWSQWPEASIGLPCGKKNGVWVLDIDQPNGPESIKKIQEQYGQLPETLTQTTGGGGTQYFWRWNGRDIKNSASKIGKNIDVRGEGGYVIIPPSGHTSGGKYLWLNKTQPVFAPEWIFDLLSSHKQSSSFAPRNGSTQYGEAALASEIVKVSNSIEGSRNQTLNAAAYSLGQLVAGGELSQEQVESALYAIAISIHLTPKEARSTINSGIRAGMLEPRRVTESGDSSDLGEKGDLGESGEKRDSKGKQGKPGENQGKTKGKPGENCYDLKQALKDWVQADLRAFKLYEAYNELGCVTQQQKKKISDYLGEFIKSGIVERVGGHRGEFQGIPLEKESQKINLKDSKNWEEDFIQTYMPLGLDALAGIMPGNIIIVAGESNAGKSAILLDWAFHSLNSSKSYTQHQKAGAFQSVLYFSSEMGSREMGLRAKAFGYPMDAWDDLKAYERNDNFHQAIDPDGLNFIDYLEIHDEFYKVGGKIRMIHEKLRDGVCVIALQKKSNSQFGRGGEMSLEKPRLYISVSGVSENVRDISIARIVKAKNYITPFNPAGMQIDFKIENRGSRISMLSDWRFLKQTERENQNRKYELQAGHKPPEEYQFKLSSGEVKTLRVKDVEDWIKAFRYINVELELNKISKDSFNSDFLTEKWFWQISGILQKKDRERGGK